MCNIYITYFGYISISIYTNIQLAVLSKSKLKDTLQDH